MQQNNLDIGLQDLGPTICIVGLVRKFTKAQSSTKCRNRRTGLVSNVRRLAPTDRPTAQSHSRNRADERRPLNRRSRHKHIDQFAVGRRRRRRMRIASPQTYRSIRGRQTATSPNADCQSAGMRLAHVTRRSTGSADRECGVSVSTYFCSSFCSSTFVSSSTYFLLLLLISL